MYESETRNKIYRKSHTAAGLFWTVGKRNRNLLVVTWLLFPYFELCLDQRVVHYKYCSNAWILDLFNSTFSNAYFERLAVGKFKTAKKIWREAVTAYFEFPSQNFFVRTWKSYPTLKIACFRSDGNSWVWNKSSEPCCTTLSLKGFIFLTSNLNCVLH